MNASKQPTGAQAQDEAAATPQQPDQQQADTQPPPSGTGLDAANRGSPAASVMKQFAKTKAEGTGRA
jgi:hypothetical protein